MSVFPSAPNPPALFAALVVLVSSAVAFGEPAQPKTDSKVTVAARDDEPLVDITRACPGVVVELRYAGSRNLTGKPIYPAGARALLRRSVADRLNRAQRFLKDRGFGLKVWDAYRPVSVQRLLWNAVRNPAYVVAPSQTGSLHSWGVAVDVTLIDFRGREARMPTDFDAFSTTASYNYTGKDPEIAFNLSTLKRAMNEAGFRHIRDEWWHYSAAGLPGCGPIEVSMTDVKDEIAREDSDDSSKPADPNSPKKKLRTERLLFPPSTRETL